MAVSVAIQGSLFRFLSDVLVFSVIEASCAATLLGTHFADGKAFTVHFNAVCFLTGATSLFTLQHSLFIHLLWTLNCKGQRVFFVLI